jgi:CubicO group peptidase (beta-lactamase class C family)
MVDLAKFGNNLANSLRNKCVGFEIAIYNDLDLEWSTGEGLAVVTPPTPITSKKRMAVMSMSKTITAAGVVKQIATMQNRGDDISLDEKIDPYLPKPWERGPGVDKLTFPPTAVAYERLAAGKQ